MAKTAPAMLQAYPQWCRPSILENDPEKLNLRWLGTVDVLKSSSGKQIEALIQVVFGRPITDQNEVIGIQKCFTEHDPSFAISENGNEFLVLSGASLASLLNSDSENKDFAAVQIVTAAACNGRKHKLHFDIVEMAEVAIRQASIETRERSTSNNQEISFDFRKALETITAELPAGYPQGVTQAFTTYSKAIALHLQALNSRLTAQTESLRRFNAIQDEELQMLWWLVNGWSETLKCQITKIPEKTLALVVGSELAEITESLPGPRCIEALISRSGLPEKKGTTISSAINACETTWLQALLNEKQISAATTPIHFAISRKLETTDDDSWVPGWAGATGIAKDHELTLTSLSRLFYFERLLLN